MPKHINPLEIKFNENISFVGQYMPGGTALALMKSQPFLLNNVITEININTYKKKKFSPDKYIKKGNYPIGLGEQIESFKEIWNNPISDPPYIYTISSIPNELQGQMLALKILLRAVKFLKYKEAKWHPVYGGYRKDDLIDNEKDIDIGFLVLTNVVENSTVNKIEKLRDILTLYSNIPRIIVTSGIDPVSFMSEKIKMPTQYVAYIGRNRMKGVMY